MYDGRDFDIGRPLPWNERSLVEDLELDTLFSGMAAGDKFLLDVAKKALVSGGLNSPGEIRYRQDILIDCMNNPAVVRDIYEIALDAINSEKKVYWGLLSGSPSLVLDRSVEVLQIFVVRLKKLRDTADKCSGRFASAGFTNLFAMLKRELSDEYFAEIQGHLQTLKFRDGVLISAGLGKGNKGVNYILRKPKDYKRGWLERVLGKKAPAYSYTIPERDESGARALSELRDRGIDQVANALARSCDHILNFFTILRTELAFYVGCLNLHERLSKMEEPVCFPAPLEAHERRHACKGLYDVCLALTKGQKVVGNDLDADGKDLVMITGANQGGKSTFLRSVGQAQLMMQSGMFVPAESFQASICDGLFTHYRREEDATMSSGKLDEELGRMSDIIDHISLKPIILFNESFAATNEREGSEIARQITAALLEHRVRVFFVTHQYTFAHLFYEKNLQNSIFLRAERQSDGKRTYTLTEGEPLQTSYGKDLYDKIVQKNPTNS